MYSDPIQKLIIAFSSLPTVGPRTAERFVFYLLKSGKKDVAELTNALKNLIGNIKSCEICWDFSDTSPCKICNDPKRDSSTICIVEESQDLQSIEKTNEYIGKYHLLRGTIRPDDEDSIKFLKIKELLVRLQNENIKEIILALNHDLSGENTMMYLEKKIKETKPNLKITRLARGLPMGSDLQYADEITLGSALKNRTTS
ncbi:recombination mediator RecR [Patescibacteria group bacterium]|nr:recombination mediator RecR [Patescibacteria group bacterium]MBU1895895.1 recombination mediator RecR [Patescibacteria group bacterium]